VQLQAKTSQHLLHLLFNLLTVTPQQDNEIIRIPYQCSRNSRHLEHFVERMQVDITQQRGNDSMNAKGNFEFDRVIKNYRGNEKC
jgi:transposase-like protein